MLSTGWQNLPGSRERGNAGTKKIVPSPNHDILYGGNLRFPPYKKVCALCTHRIERGCRQATFSPRASTHHRVFLYDRKKSFLSYKKTAPRGDWGSSHDMRGCFLLALQLSFLFRQSQNGHESYPLIAVRTMHPADRQSSHGTGLPSSHFVIPHLLQLSFLIHDEVRHVNGFFADAAPVDNFPWLRTLSVQIKAHAFPLQLHQQPFPCLRSQASHVYSPFLIRLSAQKDLSVIYILMSDQVEKRRNNEMNEQYQKTHGLIK